MVMILSKESWVLPCFLTGSTKGRAGMLIYNTKKKSLPSRLCQMGWKTDWDLKVSIVTHQVTKKTLFVRSKTVLSLLEEQLKKKETARLKVVSLPPLFQCWARKMRYWRGEMLPNPWEMRHVLLGMQEGWWHLIEELPNFPSGWEKNQGETVGPRCVWLS